MSLVRVTINGRTVEVPAGTLITDAARVAETHIPVFCSHTKLDPLGACRICVVEVGTPKLGPDRKPVMGADGQPEIAWMPKVQTACTTVVSEGMHVRTETPVATQARQGVMEFLLVNHPLDCPVCDEGGECQLQDLAFAYGLDYSRMADAKRTFESEDLGPIVKKEANRCIVCMRCVRYCSEVMGEDALTAHQRGVWTEISSFNRQPLDCEQCGNCIEVCPVGALTALPYRFKARPWDLRQHITICPYCSNGCSVRLGVRREEILRARGTEFRGVNQEFLCVRGRFGYEFVGSADRLSAPLLKLGESLGPSTFDESVTFVAARLREIVALHGAGAVAFLGGDKLTLEEQYLEQKLARAVIGTPHVDARTRHTAPVAGDAILRATGGGRAALTFDALVGMREVLVLGDDLQGEGPFAQAQLVRGARQKGLHLTVAHPRRVKLARERFNGAHLAYRPGRELALVNALTRAVLDLGDPAGAPPEVTSKLASLKTALAGATAEAAETVTGVRADAIRAAAKRLRDADRKAILFGRAFTEHREAAALVQAIENLGWASGALTSTTASVMYIGPQSNSQGALDMGLVPDRLPGYVPAADATARAVFERAWSAPVPGAGMTAPEVLAAAASGKVRALWIVGDDWLASAPDRALAEQALARAELVIVNEMFPTETAQRAHVVFPITSFAEKEGVVVNCERRLQKSIRALPPRKGTRTDGDVFQAVAQAFGASWAYRTSEDVFREIARLVPGYQGMLTAMMVPHGPQWSLPAPHPAVLTATVADPAPANNGDGLWLLAGATLFLQGSLSHRGALLPRLAGEPRAWLHPDDGRRLGIAAGDAVELTGPGGRLALAAALDDSVPAGSVFVPLGQRGAALNRLGSAPGTGLQVQVRKTAVRETVGA
jgi:NADH-quinone oxidoreductase subunit G